MNQQLVKSDWLKELLHSIRLDLSKKHINLIGIDGSGKDMQMEKLKKYFPDAITTYEPGGTEEADIIRDVLLQKDYTVSERIALLTTLLSTKEDVLLPYTKQMLEQAVAMLEQVGLTGEVEMFLYAASRSESIEKVVRPFKEQQRVIFSNRSVACSMAYQAKARNLGMEKVWSVNNPALNGIYPDIEIFIDIPVSVSKERLKNRTEKLDRLDLETEQFFEKVRQGYLEYYESYCPYPYAIIDGTKSIEEVHQDILELLKTSSTV